MTCMLLSISFEKKIDNLKHNQAVSNGIQWSTNGWHSQSLAIKNTLWFEVLKKTISPLSSHASYWKKKTNCLCYNFTTFFQRKQVIRKWFPATFDKNAKKEITKKTDKGQTKVSIISFQRYWSSRNSGIWFTLRQTWPHSTKNGSLKCYLPLMIIFKQNN